MPPQLTAFETPLGPQPVSPKLYHPEQRTLVLEEKVFSWGDDFYVKTAEDLSIVKVKGKKVSVHDRKTFSDLDDHELFTLSKKMFAVNKTFHGESSEGYNFEVKGHFKMVGSSSTVSFKNSSDGMDVELELKGDWIDRSAEIKIGDRAVASIARSYFNKREIFGGQQTYFVTVAPNVDLSLIAAICVSLDEREND